MPEETESPTNSSDQWVSDVIDRARKSNPLVPENTLATMQQLLRGQISEEKLTPTNLKKIAVQLLGDMASKQPESEETQ